MNLKFRLTEAKNTLMKELKTTLFHRDNIDLRNVFPGVIDNVSSNSSLRICGTYNLMGQIFSGNWNSFFII